MSYTNSDGLQVLTNGAAGVAKDEGTNAISAIKTLTVKIGDATALGSSAATPDDHDAFIPAGSYIKAATLNVTTAFTSGGSATLGIGAYNQAGSAIDADGIDATIALTALNATTKAVACDGALVAGAINVGAADAYIKANYGTAVFTAGAATLVIEYIEP
tara:strand:+ start:113 stop:592 length:480 start_codon:yes stop_codon:yes gene_type:complete